MHATATEGSAACTRDVMSPVLRYPPEPGNDAGRPRALQFRSRCPCAACKATREEQAKSKSRLNILPGNYSGALTAVSAERVGNYAIRIDWSDNHGSGIYSFDYLREICPCAAKR